jgi:WD40 repeat protein
MHGNVDASKFVAPTSSSNSSNNNNNRYNNNQPQQQKASVSSVAIWESGGIKIFTGSQDGYWRLWNTAGGQFGQEFESNVGKVHCVQVVNNFLFCGFEAVSKQLPGVAVGMVHAWNLQQPQQPPAELQIAAPHLSYAHNQAVTALHISSDNPPKVVSGSRDGSIRVWTFQDNQFKLAKTLAGHAREVTGLALENDLLWSCGTEGSIRIWNLTTGECQYVITRETKADGGTTPSPTQQQPPQQGAAPTGVGHTHAVTALLSYPSQAGTFILSSSLDRTVKAWNATTGACVASELHDEGVVCMSLAKDQQGNQLLLLGLESGNIQCRNLVQTAKVPAFALLFTLSTKYTAAHDGAVRSITAGPAGTFYTVGDDGKLLVFQFMGDLGLQ